MVSHFVVYNSGHTRNRIAAENARCFFSEVTCMFALICFICSKRAPSGFDPVFFSALVWTGCRKLRCRGRGTSFNTFSKPYRAATLLQPTVLRVARSRQIARRLQIRCSGHRPRCLAAVRRQKTADQVSCRQVLQWLR